MNNTKWVLVVTGSKGMMNLLTSHTLMPEGFSMKKADSGLDGMEQAETHRPDLILVVDGLPDTTTPHFIDTIREKYNTPVIVIGEKGDANELRHLKAGADDFVSHPFDHEVLWARIQRSIARNTMPDSKVSVVLVGDLEIDLHKRLVKKKGSVVSLTRTEWHLIRVLATNVGRVMSNEELLTLVWGPEFRNDLQYLRVWVSRLRKKLENDPKEPVLIVTYAGVGYALDDKGELGEALPNKKMRTRINADVHALHTPAETIAR